MVLSITNLQGFGGPPPPNPVILANSYIATTADLLNKSSYDFTSQSFGVEDSNRVIVVVVYASTSVSRSATSVTIGGVSATNGTSGSSGISQGTCSIWAAAVPTGTTGTISVVFDAAVNDCAISVYRLVGYSTTRYDYDFDTNTNPSFCTVNISADGVVISGTLRDIDADESMTWTDAVEDQERYTDTQILIGSARVTGTGVQTNYVFSVEDTKGAGNRIMVAVSFQPSS